MEKEISRGSHVCIEAHLNLSEFKVWCNQLGARLCTEVAFAPPTQPSWVRFQHLTNYVILKNRIEPKNISVIKLFGVSALGDIIKKGLCSLLK